MMPLVKNLKKIPSAPGIYLFFNSKKELIYVGKASSLKSRVKSYFVSRKSPRPIEEMIHEVASVKYIVTSSLLEAVILEGSYIKKFKPRYNIKWRDDKSWNYLVITKDKYPRLETMREHELKFAGSASRRKFLHVFGPFPGLNTKEAMRILHRIFLFSDCNPKKGRPCFYCQLGQCLGVCVGGITQKDYMKKVIRPLVFFLKGKKKVVIKNFTKQMRMASKIEDFESAARLRNQIKALQKIQDAALLNINFLREEILKGNARSLRIEGYDISNLGASNMVGSMAVFDEREPMKSQYRKFNIKTVAGQNDVGCLAEIVGRRLKHTEWPLPDIFLIDGGCPQVSAVLRILQKQKIDRPVIGIAKGLQRKKNEFIISNPAWTGLARQHENLLIRVRDEAHRFAIGFQRKKRFFSP
ncbi:MAG: Excinuclease ABC C subunit domain protein [Candidatus Magasanikbacteria bacterium GW2011_GWA2_41_55]|uniref:Excinuclease ABC C subunit domain protein n=1 Tax=Candidatus Magasanikbacteria bacterium GW2011_GWA2_41_55 TaxID=1619038 RepID=A0A0G0YU36_9BACT|nr:MAG: Excinuclease ABC C subunit domain protein [Candidatus Magasanikbacteria bacterium GW2011_GWA2_41_55]